MSEVTIWHNPRCSKSRAALELLNEKCSDIEIVKYLEKTPSFDEIREVLSLLKMKPRELMRVNEALYKELNLKDVEDEDALIKAMEQNPKLIERPVIIKDKKAVIARPIENLEELLK